MTQSSLSDREIKYLSDQVARYEKLAATNEKGTFRMIARSEAAALLLNMAGYLFDYTEGKAYRKEGNIRTYVS
jgi:hypothetical protein